MVGWGDEREVDGSSARVTMVDGISFASRDDADTPAEPTALVDGSELSVDEDADDVESSGTRRSLATAEYGRPSIPEPPAVAEAALPFELIPKNERRSTPEPPRRLDPERDGTCGVWRWRSRHDALRACIDELEHEHGTPPEVAHAMAFAARTLEELELAVGDAQIRQDRIEDLEALARDFRSTLGKAVDGVAAKLSSARATLAEVVTRRGAVRDKKDAMRKKVRAGEATEGEADALLWELAALEEEVMRRAATADELESRLAELRGELERENEAVERESARMVQWLDGHMIRIEAMARALRDPLDRVEAHVLSRWPAPKPEQPSVGSRQTPTSG